MRGTSISLRTTIIIALAAMALIPLVLTNFLTLQTAEQAIMKIVFERNRNLAENIAGDINDMFAEKIRMMKIAANNSDIRSMDPGRMVPALSHIPDNHPDLLLAIVLAPDGDLLARSDGKTPNNANYSDREYFRAATRTGQVTISDVLVSKTTGKLDIGIAEPIKNADQTLRGMLVIGVSLQKITSRIADTKLGTAGYAYVVNNKGKVIVPPDRDWGGDSADFSDLPPVKAAISGQDGWMEYEFNGQKMLVGYSYVPTTGWGLIVQQPLTDAIDAATRLRNTNILIMIVTILVAVVVAFALAGVIFKPIALLTVAAEKVAEGDLAIHANFESFDEVGILAAAFNNMTKQLRTREEDLRRSQEQYRRIVDTSAEGIMVIDKNQRLTFVNAQMSKMLGYDVEEMIGRELESFIFDEDMPDHRRQMESRSRGIVDQYERRLKHRERHEVWTNISATPIFDIHHHFDGSFGMITDITEHRKIEQQFQQAQKMESVGRLAGGVAHDFNNMLGVILGYAEIAMTQVDPAQSLFGHLEGISKAASRSADLTRQLLAFARKQIVAPKILDLNKTIEGILKMLWRLIGEHVDLVWIPGSGLWPVKMDPSQIDQILANLCVNARDAIADVGKIIIETGNETLDNEYCTMNPEANPGEYVRISVNDTGCGMDKLTLKYIFEPFFTTKGVGAGTGLGLATVYGAVKQNDGFIYVYSEPGKGTTFTIYLPRHQDVGATGQVIKEDSARHVVGGHETIMLVEDEPLILKMTTTMLQLLGYTVIAASTPGEAICLLEDFDSDIHLLMTDVIMPEMNGRDLADRILTARKGMKCLFMSGYTSDIVANQGVLTEGISFIQKPFSQKGLAAKIREVFDGGKSI